MFDYQLSMSEEKKATTVPSYHEKFGLKEIKHLNY